jgi:hypothetical protein
MRARLTGVVLTLVACSGPVAVPDGGMPSDAGQPPDGGMPPDAGPHDAGVPPFDGGWTAARATVDQPDDLPGAYQVHVLYIEPADRTASPPLDTNGTLRKSVAAFNAWLSYATGGKSFRVDTFNGQLDVTYVKLPFAELEMAAGTAGTPSGAPFLRDRLENALKTTFNDPHKLYLMYWDGLSYDTCGSGAYPPALPGHMCGIYIGGIYQATFITGAVAAGVTTVTVDSPGSLPAAPFDAKLGTEALHVNSIAGSVLTLQQPLAAAHPATEPLQANTTIPDCRTNPFSSNGSQLNYADFAGVHELMHTLGIVPPEAYDYAQPPVAPGHLAETGPDGTADLMYQGTAFWTCPQQPAAAGAAQSRCKLDSQHRNYFDVTSHHVGADLAFSVFLDPAAPDAGLPASW